MSSTVDHPNPASAAPELLVRDEGAVRWLSLNRPQTRNGLTVELNALLIAEIERAAADPAVRALVLTGEGGAFSSGLDFRAAAASVSDPDRLGDHLDQYFHAMIRALRAIPKPVIAFVDGAAAGFGCDLALACDLRVGSPRARFGETFIKRGLMPDGGGTFHLPRLVGLGVAMDLLLTGEMIDATEALRLGLVSRVYPAETAAADVLRLAQQIAAGPPMVHARVKRAVQASLGGTLDEALGRERQGQLELLRSKDFLEGVSAFFQKRDPSFRGE